MRHSVLEWLRAWVHVPRRGDAAPQPSPYVGQEARDIKAMSGEEIHGYLSGEGMGLAKAAELNGHPGPAHVLELASQLELTPEQRSQTEAALASMNAKATSLGRALVDEERKLDTLFAAKTATPESLEANLREIGSVQAQVRGAHLEAHLAQTEILTAEQTARYAQLRGYGDSSAHSGHPRMRRREAHEPRASRFVGRNGKELLTPTYRGGPT